MEMLRLGKVAIARRIPHREAHPFLARDVEGDAELLRTEGCQVRGGKNLSVDGLPVSPNQFSEFQWEGLLRSSATYSCSGRLED
jgi:hypothetical protein